MKVIIFYSKQHSGHHKAAEAIAEGFRQWVPDVSVLVRNSADFFDTRIGDFIEKAYMFAIRHIPWLWSWMYDNDRLKRRLKHVKRLNLFLNKRRLLRFIRETDPDLLLCTQAVPCEMLCIMKARGSVNVPLIAVPTDFYVHSYWIHREVDAYFVACERSRRELALRQVPLEKIHVTGIPVNPNFAAREDIQQTRTKLGLDENRKTILMMGGGLGLVAYDKLVRSILRTESNAQIVSIVGADGKRLEKLRSRFLSEHVTVLGYVNNVHEWMDASNVIVSKPGGLTCAEVLSKGLPLVMTSPLPGQEEVNVHYMLSSGAAVYAETPRQVAEWVTTLLGSETAMKYLTSKALAFGRPNAVRDIVTLAVQHASLRFEGSA